MIHLSLEVSNAVFNVLVSLVWLLVCASFLVPNKYKELTAKLGIGMFMVTIVAVMLIEVTK